MSIFKELYKLPKRKFTLESNIRKVKHTVANWHLRINKPSSLVHNTNTHRVTHHDIMALHLWLLTGQLVTLKLQTEERGRGAVSQTLLASLTVFLLKCWHQVTSAPFHYHYLHFYQRHCHCFHHVLNPASNFIICETSIVIISATTVFIITTITAVIIPTFN